MVKLFICTMTNRLKKLTVFKRYSLLYICLNSTFKVEWYFQSNQYNLGFRGFMLSECILI